MNRKDDASSPMAQEVLDLSKRLSKDWQTVVNTLEKLTFCEYGQSRYACARLREGVQQLTISVRDINNLLEREQDGQIICGQTDGDAEKQPEDNTLSVESRAGASKGLSLPWATQVDECVTTAFQDLHKFLSGTFDALKEGDYKTAISAAVEAEFTLPRVSVACTMLVLEAMRTCAPDRGTRP